MEFKPRTPKIETATATKKPVGEVMEKLTVEKTPPSKKEVAQERAVVALSDKLKSFGFEYDHNQDYQANRTKYRIARKLFEMKAIENDQGLLFFDLEKLKNMKYSKLKLVFSQQDFFDFIKTLQGYPLSEKDAITQNSETPPPQDILAWPNTAKDISFTYPDRAEKSLMYPWEMGKMFFWGRDIELPDGSKTNLAEMYTAVDLRKLKARRTPEGELLIFDVQKNQYITFTPPDFVRLSGHLLKATTDTDSSKVLNIRDNPTEYTNTFLKNLTDSGAIQWGDFRRMGGGAAAELTGTHERKLDNPKVCLYQFTNRDGISAKYYLGREKIVGTELSKTENKLTATQLDPNLIGIFEEVHGKKHLVYTMALMDSAQLREKRREIRRRLEEKGKPAKKTNISTNTHVKGGEVKKLISRYNITEILPQRSEESSQAYAMRLARLNDPDYVLNKFRVFFARCNFGVYQLPWREQIILADAILEEKNASVLLGFARKFGIEGIRTFLSLEYDRDMGSKIIQISKRIPETDARLLYSKYSEIIDATEQVQEFLNSRFTGDNAGLGLIKSIKENIVLRAKKILTKAFEGIESRAESISTLIEQISKEEESSALLSSTIRSLVEGGGGLELIKDLAIEETAGPELSHEDVSRMLEMYKSNWVNKTTPEYWELLKTKFEKSIGDSKARFRILKEKGKIIAFFRFQEIKNQDEPAYTHFGAFNVDSSYQGGKIGEVFLASALKLEKEKGLAIRCETNPNNPMLAKYIVMGFREIERTNALGEEEVKLEITPSKNTELA